MRRTLALALLALALGAGQAAAQAPNTGLRPNANPVRVAPVVLHWPAGNGPASATVLSIAGTQVTQATFTADPGRWSWDLTMATGEPVANGAYYVVVRAGDGRAYRRRIIVAR